MKVLQATAWFGPYDVGGTEVYLEGLLAGLRAQGVKTSVVVPRHILAPQNYEHQGVTIETYPVNAITKATEFTRNEPHKGFDQFYALLEAHRDAIYHQHSWTRGCGPHHLRAAKELGLKTILTIHVPGNACLRGTMMRFGSRACDGQIRVGRCAACWAQEQGAPRPLAEILAYVPACEGRLYKLYPSRVSTALSARFLAIEKLKSFREMVDLADRIVVVCQWLKNAFLINGAPAEKLILSRQGVSTDVARGLSRRKSESQVYGSLRLLYLGRLTEVKGIDVVVRAVRALPSSTDVMFSIHGLPAVGDADYESKLRALAGDDPRIVFNAPVTRSQLPDLLVSHDAIAVPSRWLETGPIVVLEAMAAGLFVIGSRLGGIAELVDSQDRGELVAEGDVVGWSSAITRAIARKRLGILKSSRSELRTMDDVAREMVDVYRELSD